MESFVVYFDYDKIELDCSGDICNEKECIYIAEYDEDGNFIRRVDYNWKGVVSEIPMNITVDEMEQLDYKGDGSETPQEAYEAFSEWLNDRKEWVEDTPATYLEPADYVCIGLS